VPPIAAVDGAAVGFGCDLALACDLRIASRRAWFAELFVRRGLMPDGGGTFTLPRLIGLGRALELMFTGDRVDAERAVSIGLCNRLVEVSELVPSTRQLAESLAGGPPLVYAAIKRAVYGSLDGTLDSALDRELEAQVRLLQSKDFAEGIAAFMGKRHPIFQGC